MMQCHSVAASIFENVVKTGARPQPMLGETETQFYNRLDIEYGLENGTAQRLIEQQDATQGV